MKKTWIFSLLFFLGIQLVAVAQPGWNWPEDRATAEEKNALYTDFLKQDNFKAALPHLDWLLANAPDLNESLYINGAKIYEGLADNEPDAAKTVQYQEQALSMYDKRIQYFGNEGDVLNRKGYTAYKYYKDNKAKYPDLIKMFEKVYELNGVNTLDNNLLAFMDVVRRFKLTGGAITDVQVLDYYDEIMAIIDLKKATGKNLDRIEKISENIDKLLTATVTVDCEFVENNLGPKLKADPTDLKLAKKILQLQLTGKCTDSPLFMTSSKIVNEKEPTYSLTKVIAQKLAAEGKNEEAFKYYNQAVELADDNQKKAEIYYDMARINASDGQKVSARANARKALSMDPSFSDAYTLIGNLYLTSYEDCRGGESKVKDRAVYIAAYEMYKKAGNSQGMEKAKEQFPSIGEIFEEGMKEGDVLSVGCWVQESVTLQRRPA
ncbi:MAG: tetratricopeptide repeat protein [Imperialibacter sp.]|uniref:tetratricopeptide repeat protein n=1 Tax=Imperialibacter sp. TaxID=2038411 RepID=UPI003A869988